MLPHSSLFFAAGGSLVSAEMRNYRHATDVRDGAEDDIVTK
jgi:hypothetical protein